MKLRLITIASLSVVGAGIVFGALYGGFYNIAATQQHTGPIYRLLSMVRNQSVAYRASDVDVPNLQDVASISRGAHLYEEHCQTCHGGPGVAPDSFAKGMLPVPPNLVQTARDLSSAELFWAVQEGIKMTGMPAWKFRLSRRQIWDVVAYTQTLPTIVPYEHRRRLKPVMRKEGQLDASAPAKSKTIPDPERGRIAVQQYGCTSCHIVEGTVGPQTWVGPPLRRLAKRKFVAGVIPNTLENMARWIEDPVAVEPLTAMPDMGVPPADARDIAAYLRTLE